MKFLRKQLPWSVAVLLAVSAVLFGGTSASAESSEDAVCDEASSGVTEAGLVCYQSFCNDESDCWNACPSALSVACVQGACYYQQSTGGGGGGGPVCPMSFCSEDFHCECKGATGVCGSDNLCYY